MPSADGTTVHRLDGHRGSPHRSRGRRVRRPRRRAPSARRASAARTGGDLLWSASSPRGRPSSAGGAQSRDEWLASRDEDGLDRGATTRTARASSSSRRRTSTGHVRPLKDSLERMDSSCPERRARPRRSRTGRCRRQVTTSSERTGSLANALRTPHVRGRWGEAQLRNVVEYAGMVEHCDYITQATVSTDDGALRPDLVVRHPGREARRRRREGAARRVSRRLRDLRRGRARAPLRRIMRARSESTSASCPPRATGGSSIRPRTSS